MFDIFFFFSSRRRHTRSLCDWSSDVCSSDLILFERRGEQAGYRIAGAIAKEAALDRKSTRLNSSHTVRSYAVFCLKKKNLRDSCLSVLPPKVETLGYYRDVPRDKDSAAYGHY